MAGLEALRSLLGTYEGKEIEVEARLRHFPPPGVRDASTALTWVQFQRILEGLRKNTKQNPAVVVSTDSYLPSPPREYDTSIRLVQEQGKAPYWERKRKIGVYDLPEEGLRFSASVEEKLKEAPPSAQRQSFSLVRNKQRYRFLLNDGNFAVDLTIVQEPEQKQTGRQGFSQPETVYEVEIEMLVKVARGTYLPELHRQAQLLWQLANNSHFFYTMRERDRVANDAVYALGLRVPPPQQRDKCGRPPLTAEGVLKKKLVNARNLKPKDLVYGGIVGKTTWDAATRKQVPEPYTLTHKADGDRFYLIFHQTGIWALAPENDCFLVWRGNAAGRNPVDMILIAEYIPQENRLGDVGLNANRYWFLYFDCILYQGISAIQNLPHSGEGSRMSTPQIRIKDFSELPQLTIWAKTFHHISSVDRLFEILDQLLYEKAFLPYKEDGEIVTPALLPYDLSSSSRVLLKDRILTKYADTCKLKRIWPTDFKIHRELGQIILLDSKDITLANGCRERQYIPFKGYDFRPFNPKQVLQKDPLTDNLPEGIVAEYGWDAVRQLMVPLRVRPDKKDPNPEIIAQDNWEQTHNGITLATLQGRSFQLSYRYQNRIKRDLYASALARSNKRRPTLLDIGSGQGGTVDSWKNFGKIVAVEPNNDYIPELRNRAQANGLTQEQLMIVVTGGEDWELIGQAVKSFLGGAADVVSFMQTLTFMYKDETMFQNVVRTIVENTGPNSQIIFSTMDGDVVQQYFTPLLGTAPKKGTYKVKLGPASLTYKPGEKVPGGGYPLRVNLEDSKIVHDQDEYLVFLGDLERTLQPFGFEMISFRRADQEALLNPAERVYTSFYSYGIWQKTSPGIPLLTNVSGTIGTTGIETEQKILEENRIPMYVPRATLLPEQSSNPSLERAQTQTLEGRQQAYLNPSTGRSQAQVGRNAQQEVVGGAAAPKSPKRLEQARVASGKEQASKTPRKLPGTLKGKTLRSPTVSAEELAGEKKSPLVRELGAARSILAVNQQGPDVKALGDDDVEEIKCSWLPAPFKIYRVATIPDGSCFIHAYLKGVSKAYQDNQNYGFRVDMAQDMRKALALFLYSFNEQVPPRADGTKFTYWETISNGNYPCLLLNQIKNFGIILQEDDDYTLAGLQAHFNSSEYLGQSVYQYIADLIGVDIYIFIIYNNDLQFTFTTARQENPRPAIAIGAAGPHYELIVISNGEEKEGEKGTVQSMLPPSHPLLNATLPRFGQASTDITLEEYRVQNNQGKRDYDAEFIKCLTGQNLFSVRAEFDGHFPPAVRTRFQAPPDEEGKSDPEQDDPFLQLIKRYYPLLAEGAIPPRGAGPALARAAEGSPRARR